MTRSAARHILLNSGSHGAQEYRLFPRFYAFELEGYDELQSGSVAQDGLLGFLARLRLWLRLLFPIFQADQTRLYTVRALNSLGRNRRSYRQDRHERPLAYRTYVLGHILLRRYGCARFVQWLCKFTLWSRLERCFLPRRRFWDARRCFADCAAHWHQQLRCSAPFSPD